jgi:hypothetical protein
VLMEIVVRMDPQGNVRVDGPLGNKALCYGMLEAAKDAIREWRPPEIVVPDGGTAGQLLARPGRG